MRCCQGASASLLPASLRDLAFAFDSRNALALESEFHLHPHYRAKLPLEATLLKTESGLDVFITEKYAEQIAAILAQWSAGLLRSPQDIQAVEGVLAPDFSGTSLQPPESRLLRSGSALEIHQNKIARQTALGRDAFLQGLRSALSGFSEILTAEFQVTSIDAIPSGLRTRVRYELVGSGKDFYRAQHGGQWELTWQRSSSGEFRLRNWEALDETQSRSARPIFVDVTAHAFGSNSSYPSQLLRGTDYWRTVLDGACGIDIYGHNGVSVADIDNDGFDDVYVCQPAGLPNRLYRNRGDGTFEDITESSGVGVLENTACAIFADIDNDGRQDLIVVRTNGPLLFLNEGGGKFRQKRNAFQVASAPQGTFTGAAVADYDRDGWLDVYFCLYVYYQGTDQYKYPSPYYDAENGPPNFMMRNNRDGTFSDVTARTGLYKNNNRYSFCCGWTDYNRDGWPDLYVVNDFGRKNLYRNNGDGTFTDIAGQAGVEDVGAGMGVCWFDYDNDGADDIYVADMWTAAGERISTQQIFQKAAPEKVRAMYRKHAIGNSLFRNNGDGSFHDASFPAGVGMGRWSWSCDAWDFDHDGRLEVLLKNRNGPQLRLLSNIMKDLPPSISFRLRGVKSNRDAIGAVVTLQTESGRQTRTLQAGSGFLSQHSKEIFFGLGEAKGPVRATIRWPSGLVQKLHDLPLNHRIWVEEGTEPSRVEPFKMGRAEFSASKPQETQPLPTAVETWLLAPLPAPDCSLPDLSGRTRPLSSLRGKPVLLNFWSTQSANYQEELQVFNQVYRRWAAQGLQLLTVSVDDSTDPGNLQSLARDPNLSFPILLGSDDVAGIYNILYRYLFDRHRDLGLPTSFLINNQGEIVKVYQGPVNPEHVETDFRNIPQTAAERIAKALPFPGVIESSEFRRNHLSYGSVFFQREYFDQAEASFRSALRDDPASAEALYGLGSVYLKQEKTADARQAFEQAIKLQASYPDTLPNAWNNLGLLLTREGRTAEAIQYFQQALKLSPDHLVALENLGNAYRAQKQWDEARKVLEHAVAIGPEDPDASYSLGMVFAQLNDTQQAYEYLQRALKLRPDYLEALNNMGVLNLLTQRRDEAVASFQECIRVAPGFDQSYLNLARVYALEGASDKARSILLDLLKHHPGHERAQEMLKQLPK